MEVAANHPQPVVTPASKPIKPESGRPESGRPKLKALVERDSCVGCEYCVHWCPVPACLQMEGGEKVEGNFPLVHVNIETCIGCKLCEQNCPYDAIHVHKLAPEEIDKARPLDGIIDQPYSDGGLD